MYAELDNLINTLRQELVQQSELLALLEQQQEAVLLSDAEAALRVTEQINGVMARILDLRRERTRYCRALAGRLGRPDTATVTDLAAELPDDHRLLVMALLDQNEHLLGRIHDVSHQNVQLLTHSVHLMEKFMNEFFGGDQAQPQNERDEQQGRHPQVPEPTLPVT